MAAPTGPRRVRPRPPTSARSSSSPSASAAGSSTKGGFAKLSDLVKAQPFLEFKTVGGSNGPGQVWVRLKGRRGASSETKKAAPGKKATAKKA